MRWFLTRRVPAVRRLLLVESGPRDLGERALARLRQVFGHGAAFDVLHCLAEPPGGASESWSVRDCAGGGARWRLLRQVRSRRHPAVAILAAGDPIMAPWRWAALAFFPAKILIVNENADFFWLDRGNVAPLFQFLRHRSGLGGESAVRTLARLAAFPLALLYLLVYAAYVHSVRVVRRLFRIERPMANQ